MQIIKRGLLEELKAHLNKKEISLITGARQVGKTTLMFFLKNYLERKNLKTLFLSLDIENDKQFFISQNSLIKRIKLEFGNTQGYVFIDEIQRKENAGLFLKGIYDLNLSYKFIISGSGSIELKEKIHESLVGRKRIFELNSVSLGEFIDFKTDYRYTKKLYDFFNIEKIKTEGLVEDYLSFGGYPRVILEDSLIEKRRIIDEIFQSYLEKDISYLLKIEKTESFIGLIKILASQTGGLVNYSEISSTLGISLHTVKNYIQYAEKTFIFKRISPFFRNIRKEITKSPIIYFTDIGLRNYASGVFGISINPQDKVFIFQNLIFNILKEKISFRGISVNFWRTKDKAEVDFVLDMGKEILPVEVKYKNFDTPRIEISMKNFIKKYQPQKALIINRNFSYEFNYYKTKVLFLTAPELIFYDIQFQTNY